MANLNANTRFTVSGRQSAAARVFANWENTTSITAAAYIHMKTNMARQSGIMFAVEADGYAYGNSANIRCAWGGYTFVSDANIIGNALCNQYTGMSANGMYYSTDGYVVLKAYCAAPYCLSFSLSSFNTAPYQPHGFDIVLTAVDINFNSGNYY